MTKHYRTGFGALLAAFAALQAARGDDKLQYNRDIRPILAENCFACHGPDSAARKAGLRLDRRDEAIKAEAIVPGKPDKSSLQPGQFALRPEGTQAGRGSVSSVPCRPSAAPVRHLHRPQ